MTTKITRSYVLQNLLQCEHCQSPLRVHPGPVAAEDVFRCSRATGPGHACAAPDIRARRLENFIIPEIAEAFITPKNIAHMRRYLAQEGYDTQFMDPRYIEAVTSDPFSYTAPDAIPIAQSVLPTFIKRVSITSTKAVVHYSIPLPDDGPLPGAVTQTIDLPADIIT